MYSRKMHERRFAVLKSVTPDLPWGALCQTKSDITKPFDTGAMLTLSFFGLMSAIMAVSTLYDYLTRNTKQHPLLTAFSIKTNGTKVFTVEKNAGEFSCLYGIKCLSMMYVILGHLASTFMGTPMDNMLNGLDYLNSTKSMFFGNNAQYAVETFFLITGMLIVYNFLILTQNGNGINGNGKNTLGILSSQIPKIESCHNSSTFNFNISYKLNWQWSPTSFRSIIYH
ncbi:unnamed protein product [Ceutorhynchus assimilis]|uniref:Uncharacterized protein n=1 Tax=Ceutorhynchus assimilis TaxID=467358 RepID=A0A9N9QQF8_9CUCU|nr:unnamed protein product [Ceutorhynchus assimilis]